MAQLQLYFGSFDMPLALAPPVGINVRRPLVLPSTRRPLVLPIPVDLYQEDCRIALRSLADNSIDSVVTDPPYHLTSTVARYSKTHLNGAGTNEARARASTDQYARLARGFMGKTWDGGSVAFDPATWVEVFHVLKPGGYVLAFGGTRTYHRMACAIEDAGFEIRDQIGWLYGQGFPKSHNLDGDWDGWGTALKPGWEPIVLARKPFKGSVPSNVLRHGTGALNIDGCRVATNPLVDDPRLGGKGTWRTDKAAKNVYKGGYSGNDIGSSAQGRWPANVIHDGSDEVLAAFAAFGERSSGAVKHGTLGGHDKGRTIYGFHAGYAVPEITASTGTAARFYYAAKASKAERCGSKHPTIKPLALMRYLCRLITPPGGTILDPFAGTGTTGQAAVAEGFKAVLMENDPESCDDIRRRLPGVRL